MVWGMRVVEWAFCRKDLTRVQVDEVDAVLSNSGSNANKKEVADARSGILWDALDLTLNFRGRGWNGAQILPPEVRPTSSTSAFLLSTLVSATIHPSLFGLMLSAVRSLSPSTFGLSAGGTFYDPSLPPYHRYAPSSFITLAGGITIYAIFHWHMTYDIITIICISVFQRRPTRWLPIFDLPWLSTSLQILGGDGGASYSEAYS
jgi:hypothetical protein